MLDLFCLDANAVDVVGVNGLHVVGIGLDAERGGRILCDTGRRTDLARLDEANLGRSIAPDEES
jgi:hypothetical protein